MIKLLDDERVGANGKLRLGGVDEKKRKETFRGCVSITPKRGLIA